MKPKIRVQLACAAVTMLVAFPAARAEAASSNSGSKSVAVRDLSRLPVSMQSGISATLGRDDSRYLATPIKGGFHIANPGQQLSANLTPAGADIAQGAANWQMSLRAYGYGAKLGKAGVTSIEAHENRVDYHRGSITEWYVNGPLGMEQGFTINNRPGIGNAAPLTLEIGLSGNVTPKVDAAGKSLTLASKGSPVLRYTGLVASDAKGAPLKSWMEVNGNSLLLHVEDSAAQYPVTVDPYVQTAVLTSSDSVADDHFGYSVAVNNDYAVVGAPFANGYVGAVYVFANPTASTSTYTAKLTASDGISGDFFGVSVDIASNDTIVVGAPFINSGAGGAYTFAKPSGGFTDTSAYTTKLTAYDGASSDYLGFSVSIGDHVIVLGAPGTSNYTGSAVTYPNPPATGQTAYYTTRLTDSAGAEGDYFGWQTAAYQYASLIGTPYPNDFTGKAILFNGFTAKFTSSDSAAGDGYGLGLGMDGSGGTDPTTIAIGAPFNDNEKGAAYIYAKPSGTEWTTTSTSTAKLTSSDSTANQSSAGASYFGYTLSLSGSNLAIGAPGNNNMTGGGYVYTAPSSGWATTSTPDSTLVPSPNIAGGYFALSTKVAPNGTVIMGAPGANSANDSTYTGTAYIYK